MSRYIDADEAIKVMACEMYAEAQSQGYDVDDIEDFMPEAKAWLNDAPSIDIVFCKECENWQTDWVPEEYECVEDLHYCAVVDGCKFSDFFCADGERREP